MPSFTVAAVNSDNSAGEQVGTAVAESDAVAIACAVWQTKQGSGERVVGYTVGVYDAADLTTPLDYIGRFGEGPQ